MNDANVGVFTLFMRWVWVLNSEISASDFRFHYCSEYSWYILNIRKDIILAKYILGGA
jgi:hypothetical protein